MNTTEAIIDAALRLAARGPWSAVTLQQIAAEAGLGLDALVGVAPTKAAILTLYIARIDRRLLASLQSDPVEGGAHDRLFDIMLRRLELMTDDKKALASIVADPGIGPQDWTDLFKAGFESQGWTLAAGGFASEGFRSNIYRLGLARIQARALREWLNDSDSGLARTMAALDRDLRDSEDLIQRIERPLNIAMSLYRGFRTSRRKDPPKSRQEDEPAYATAD